MDINIDIDIDKDAHRGSGILILIMIWIFIWILMSILTRVHQSPKNFVGASAMPTEKFLRVRKVFARIYKIKPKHQLKSE